MGHVHILVPEDADIVKPALQRKDIKFLYHTAELFQFKKGSLLDGELIGDTWLQWRYYSRNFVGELEEDKNLKVVFAKDSPYNTVRGLEGYRQVETLYMSSSEKGCFSYNHSGERMFFDISRLK